MQPSAICNCQNVMIADLQVFYFILVIRETFVAFSTFS